MLDAADPRDAAEKMTSVTVRVESDQVGAEEAVENLLPPEESRNRESPDRSLESFFRGSSSAFAVV